LGHMADPMEMFSSQPRGREGDDAPVLAGRLLQVVKGHRTILDVDEIAVMPGEVLAVIGPNGAGKSTLLSVLSCLEFPARGRVFYKGGQVTRKDALSVRRRMAVVFQEALLLDGTVLENVELGLKLRGHRAMTRETALVWLERFGILQAQAQMAHTLSGGEAQRTSLARAFALTPEILFMDEPFSSVDVLSRQGLIESFKEAQAASGTTTVLVTHDFREVAALASRVLVLSGGRLQAAGTPAEIAYHPVWGALAGIGRANS